MRQFGDFGTRLGISTNILINRLERLVQEGLLRRTTDDEDTHRKALYLLTPKGRDFYAILIAIQSWADEWIHHRVRSPVKLRHAPCQKPLLPWLMCIACGLAVTHAEGRIRIATSERGLLARPKKALRPAQMEAGVTSHLKVKHAPMQKP